MSKEHVVLKAGTSAEDLVLFGRYCEKNKAVGDAIHSWIKVGISANSILLGIAAFLLKTDTAPGDVENFIVLALCLLGGFFSFSWVLASKNLDEWQRRTSAVIAAFEKQIIQDQLLVSRESDRAANEAALKQCGMWHMINIFGAPTGKTSEMDVVTLMGWLPAVFAVFWVLALVIMGLGFFV